MLLQGTRALRTSMKGWDVPKLQSQDAASQPDKVLQFQTPRSPRQIPGLVLQTLQES